MLRFTLIQQSEIQIFADFLKFTYIRGDTLRMNAAEGGRGGRQMGSILVTMTS